MYIFNQGFFPCVWKTFSESYHFMILKNEIFRVFSFACSLWWTLVIRCHMKKVNIMVISDTKLNSCKFLFPKAFFCYSIPCSSFTGHHMASPDTNLLKRDLQESLHRTQSSPFQRHGAVQVLRCHQGGPRWSPTTPREPNWSY